MSERDIVEKLRRKVFHGPTMEASHTRTLEWQAADEIDRLRAEVERLRAGGCARDQTTTQYCAEAARLAAENLQLRAALLDIDTACKNPGSWSEIVMERIIERVEEIARAALQDKSDWSGEGKAAIEGSAD